MITSRNRRDRTRQFFSARRELARALGAAPSRCWSPAAGLKTSGGEPFWAATGSSAAAEWPLAECRSTAAEGMRRLFLVLDSTALAPLTMGPVGVQRHAGAAGEPTWHAPSRQTILRAQRH